jgi:hypothetical protein
MSHGQNLSSSRGQAEFIVQYFDHSYFHVLSIELYKRDAVPLVMRNMIQMLPGPKAPALLNGCYHRVHTYRGRVEIEEVYLPSQLERTLILHLRM